MDRRSGTAQIRLLSLLACLGVVVPVVALGVRPAPNLRINAPATERHLVEWVKDLSQKTGFSKFVVGNSGGLDSAVVMGLAAKAVGGHNIFAVQLPSAQSSDASLVDAEHVRAAFGIPQKNSETVKLAPSVHYLSSNVTGKPDWKAIGNLTARLRTATIMYKGEVEHALPLGTGNLSEILLGYFTAFGGDGSLPVLPIGRLYKMQVFELGKQLGVPPSVTTKAPSADLVANQTDEGELGAAYKVIDPILSLAADQKAPRNEIIEAGFDPAVVDRVLDQVEKTQFKRDGVHLGPAPALASQ